jgi:serine/threonine-protein kinase
VEREPPSADSIVESILDGRPIDWGAAEENLAGSRSLLESLKIVAAVASFTISPDLQSGAIDSLSDRFELRGLIGRGGSAVVHRAWDRRLHREIAIKILHPAGSHLPSVVDEARRLARVRHRGVATIYDVHEFQGTTVICMELLRGRTLDTLVREQGLLPAQRIAEIGGQLCSALAAVHQVGLLHRDIKAHNVMVEDDGRVVLMDFGVGTEFTDRRVMTAGTPVYMAPELLAGHPAGPESDIYSVGVLLYYLATAAYPWAVDTLTGSRADQPRTQLKPVRVPAGGRLGAVIARALHPDPAARFPSASAMAAALRESVGEKRRVFFSTAVAVLLVMVTLLVLLALRSQTSVIQTGPPGHTGMIARQLTTPDDMGGLGGISPDGTLATYLSTQGDLKLLEIDTGATHFVARGSGEGAIVGSRFRPLHSTVVFSVEVRVCDCLELREVALTGGQTRVLLRDPDLTSATVVSITPDGLRALIHAVARSGLHQLGIVDLPRPRFLPVVNVPPNMQTADLSRDGRFVVYDQSASSRDLAGDIWIADTENGASHVLVDGSSDDTMPLWAPDGRHVLFASMRTGTRGLWSVPVNNGHAAGHPEIVQRDMGLFMSVSLNSRGTLLYWQSPVIDIETIAFDPAQGRIVGGPRPATSRFKGSNSAPAWSGDGRALVYVSERKVLGPARSTIVIRSLDTEAERDIAVPINGPLEPAWSPDGRTLVVRGPGAFDGITGARLIDVESGAVRKVIPANGLWSFQWAPDSRAFYFVGPKGIHRADAVNGHISPIQVDDGWTAGRIALSPDGTLIGAYAVRGKAAGVIVVSASGGTPRVLLQDEDQRNVPIVWDWTPDRRHLLAVNVSRAPQGLDELLLISVADRTVSSTGLRRRGLAWVRARPDGREIAYRAGRERRTLWTAHNLLPRSATN